MKHIIVFSVLALLLGGLYYAVNFTGFFAEGTETVSDVEARTLMLQKQVLNDLQTLKTLSFETSVIKSDTYRSLEDLRTDIGEPVVSHEDLFQPLF